VGQLSNGIDFALVLTYYVAMNPRQTKFAKLYLSGIPAGRAYEQAGYEMTGDAADMAGSRLIRNDKVRDYITTMSKKTEAKTVKTVLERKEMLSRIMDKCEYGENFTDAIRASSELCKMDGGYEPERQEISTRIIIGGDAD
jgi:phage terminase small subunit